MKLRLEWDRVLGRGSNDEMGVWGSDVSSPSGAPENLEFCNLGPQKSLQNCIIMCKLYAGNYTERLKL